LCEKREGVSWLCLTEQKPFLEKETYTHGEDNPDQRAFPTFSGGDEREFVGAICTGRRAKPGRSFLSCNRSGNGTDFPAGGYERRREKRRDYRNGYYERDFVTRFGTIRLRIARTRQKSFLRVGLRRFQRRAEEVSLLIREAFLRGISTRPVGRVVATITGETVSAQTVSKLTRDLDEAVRQFHQAQLNDDYVYLFLDGVSLRVRRPTGRKQVQMLVAYGIRQDGSRHLLAFLRSQGEGQADWEALLEDLYRRGLEGRSLGLILTDGCAGLAAAIRTVYPRVRHQHC
jgi:putative transposase